MCAASACYALTLRAPLYSTFLHPTLPYPFPSPSPYVQEALQALSHFASDPQEAARLARLASHEGRGEYQEWISKPHRSLLEVGAECRGAEQRVRVQ